MLTLFTIPKAFHGHNAIIQRNAIKSWTLMQPRAEIILFGDDEGTAETATTLGVRHLPRVARNEYGTPLLNDLFRQADDAAAHDVLCYVNADVILMSDFFSTVEHIIRWNSRYLLVGRRWDIDIRHPLDFLAGWENELRTRLSNQGVLHAATGMDYFVFPRYLWQDIPSFAIGRTAWDNWLIYGARAFGVPVVDAKNELTVLHQAHDYLHIPANAIDVLEGPEAKRNLQLAGGWKHIFTLNDATHILRDGKPTLAIGVKHLQRRLTTIPTLYASRKLAARGQKTIDSSLRPARPSQQNNRITKEASFDAER